MTVNSRNLSQPNADCKQEDGLTNPETKPDGYGNIKETDKLVESNGQSEDEDDIYMLLQRPKAS